MLAKCGRSLYGLALITPSEFVVRLLRDIPSTTSAIRPPRASICLYLDCQTLASVAVLPLGKFCASALAPSLEWRYFDFDWHRAAGLARGYNTIKCRASKREGEKGGRNDLLVCFLESSPLSIQNGGYSLKPLPVGGLGFGVL